jgi:pimeloyl-ACP methyl ester carboxylesterase
MTSHFDRTYQAWPHKFIVELRMHRVVTVHGIRTFGNWQDRLELMLHQRDPSIQVLSCKYGYFSIIAFLIPPVRWLLTRWFARQLLDKLKIEPGDRIDLVGHSFGTHLIGWGLVYLAQHHDIRLHTVILAGSVLRRDFDWADLLRKGVVKRVVNDCGIRDDVLIVNQLFVLFTGMAGRLGFVGVFGSNFRNRYFRGGHSLYFVDEMGADSNAFMQRYWIPILLDEQPISPEDQRGTPTPLQGLITTALQNAEPIKLAAYLILFAAPAVYFYALNMEAQTQRKRAQAAELHALDRANDAERRRVQTLEALVWMFNESALVPVDRTLMSSEVALVAEGILSRMKEIMTTEKLEFAAHLGTPLVRRIGDVAIPEPCELWRGPRPYDQVEIFGASRAYALALSQRWADGLRAFAASKGIDASQISTIAYGKERPKHPMPNLMGSMITPTQCKAWNSAAIRNNRVSLKVTLQDGRVVGSHEN